MNTAVAGTSTRTYQIGDVSCRTGLSQRTIRHYDDLGLVKPSARTNGGFRLYTEADVERFLLIKPFKPLGIGLDVVRRLLGAVDTLTVSADDTSARRVVAEVLGLVAERRQELDEALAASERTVGYLGSLTGGPYPA